LGSKGKEMKNYENISILLTDYYHTLRKEKDILNEPSATYGTPPFPDSMMLYEIILKGVPYSLFNTILKLSPFTKQEWADFLGLSIKTFQRAEADNKILKPIHTEKILELSEVIEKGKEIFGSMDTFKQWLSTPSFALGNKSPKELLSNSFGKELVMEELINIDQGIFV
jgi:putative toxin-antitoxin system antitoxin component (TIGR02293 family)